MVEKVSNSLPNNKILDWFKLKAFAEDKLNVAKMLISVFDSVENVGKKEKMQVTSISLFPTMFSKGFFLSVYNPFPNDKFWTIQN